MTKISKELEKYKDTEIIIKYYKRILAEWEKSESYFEHSLQKEKKLKLIKKTLGDIDIKDEYLDVFLDIKNHFAETPDEIKKVYNIIVDTDLSKSDVSALVESYYLLKEHPEMFIEIKKSIGKDDDFLTVLDKVSGSREVHTITDSYRIEFLKGTFKERYPNLHQLIRYCNMSVSDLMEILPSKKFMNFSERKARELTRTQANFDLYLPAKELVLSRFEFDSFDKKYKESEMKLPVVLTDLSYGSKALTSFTKAEYEEDLEKAVQLRKKKGPGYIGW